MDVTQLPPLITFDEVMTNHVQWLLMTIPIIWAAIAGAGIRLLLIRAEPFWMRSQNATAGILLAVTLSNMTAHLLTNGNYVTGYAVVYGMVGRELFLTFYDFMNDKAAPVFMATLRYFFPFAFKDEDNHDRS